MRASLIAIGFLLLAGCAHYEFNIVRPPDLAKHVGRSEDAVAAFTRDGLDYRLQAYEGRLVMLVGNPGDEPVEILGAQSFVVDPQKQSHPIPSQAIGPKSYVRLIFPPLRPYYAAPGYAWDGWPYDDGYFPMYVVVPNVPPGYFWDWEDQTSVTIRLACRRGQQNFALELVVARVKVK